jgi:hypothetical protein
MAKNQQLHHPLHPGHRPMRRCSSQRHYGNSVAQSNAMARDWWLKAALQEHENAIKNLKLLDQEEGKTTPTLPSCATCGTNETTKRPLNACSQCHQPNDTLESRTQQRM